MRNAPAPVASSRRGEPMPNGQRPFPHGLSRPVPVVGHCYRNGAGQVRRLLSDASDTAEFQVISSGPNPGFTCQYPVGLVGLMRLSSFRQWLVAEVDEAGRPVLTPGIRAPRAAAKRSLARREFLPFPD